MKTVFRNIKVDKDKTVTLDCEVLGETPKAFRLDVNGEEVWVPKSQIRAVISDPDESKLDQVTMSTWIAETKGFVAKESGDKITDDNTPF
jgi:hypothetical protein